ncbi:MAG: serine/threonine-protein kinase [Gemmataceae bacterium]
MLKSFSEIGLLGSYEVLEKVGAGGMGTVYKARNPKNGQTVAIKVLAPEYVEDSMLLKRFRREFDVASKLDHPHIVRVLEYGMDGNYPYIVMEYVEGTSLAAVLRRQKRLSETDAVRIMLQIAEALHLAHQNRIIHRDVNPANILLDPHGQTRLIDLGLVKEAGASVLMTRSKTCMGTLIYAAPEQFEDAGTVDARADIYSLGATMYQAVTGAYPFQSGNTFTMLQRKLNNQLTDPQKLVPDLSRRVCDAILKAMHPRPEHRPADCAEFASLISDHHHLARWHVQEQQSAAQASNRRPVAPPAPKKPAPMPARVPVSTEEPKSDERRRADRHVFGGRMDCRPLLKAMSDPITAEAIDISATGLGLVSPRRFEKGSLIQIEFPEKGGGRESIVVKVCWVRKHNETMWSMGGRFHRPLTDVELQGLLSQEIRTVVLAKSDYKK